LSGRSAGAGGCAEHGAAGGNERSEGAEAQRLRDVVVDGFHAAVAVIGFVPEASAAGILQEFLPPFAVRVGARPFHEGVNVAPVLAHADVHGKEGIEQVLVAEEAVGPGRGGVRDLRAEADESFDPVQAIDTHAEINDNEVGVSGEIDRSAVNFRGHRSSHH